MSASQPSADPDLQDLLSGLRVVQTPSASATPRAGGGLGVLGVGSQAFASHGHDDEGTYLSTIDGQVTSVISTPSPHGQATNVPRSVANSFEQPDPGRLNVPPSVVNSATQSDAASVSGTGLSSDKRYKLVQVAESNFAFSKYCLKTIGQGPCICIAVDCSVNHQGENKSTVVSPGDLMVVKGGNSAFLDPRVGGSRISKEVTQSWTAESKTLREWNVLFALANFIDTEADDDSDEDIKVSRPFTHADISAKEEFAAKANLFRTPLKRKVNVLSEPAYLAFSPYKKQFRVEDDSTPHNSEDLLARIYQTIKVMDIGLEETSHLLLQFMTSYEESSLLLSKGLKSIEYRAASFENEFGSPPSTLSPEFASPTAWGTIAGIASKVTEIDSQMISTFDLRAAIVTSEQRTRVFVDPVFKDVKSLEERVVARVKTLLAAMTSNHELSFSVGELKATLVEAIRLLTLRIAANSDRLTILEQVSAPVDTIMSSPDARSGEAFDQFERRVSEMEIEMNRLTSQTDQQAIRFSSLGFRGKDEADAWLAINEPSHDYGLFVDAHMVLEHVQHAIFGDDSLKRLESLYKLKIETIAQGLAITSFEAKCPKIFDKKTAQRVVKDDSSYFDCIPTFGDWDELDGGWREKIKSELSSFTTGHEKSIIEAFDSSSRAYALARLSLTESVSWVEGFVSFIDDYYKELTKGKFGSRKGWHVTTRLAKRLIEEVASPRIGVIKMLRTGQQEQISQTIFWSTLRSLDVMAGIKANNYKNDPLVSSELVKFLAINTGFASIEKLQREVEELQTKVNIAVKSANASDAACKTATNRSDEMKKLYEILVKRVTKLEKP
jgi:hypothetical protein